MLMELDVENEGLKELIFIETCKGLIVLGCLNICGELIQKIKLAYSRTKHFFFCFCSY